MRGTIKGLLGLAVGAVFAAGAASAQPSQTLSVEGGAACTSGSKIWYGTETLGKGECGWTGALRFDQSRTPLWMGFDAWGVGGRYMSVDETSGANKLGESRTTLDFDMSRSMGMGLLGLGPSRLFAGLRYTGYDFDATMGGRRTEGTYWGVGPRIGTTGTIVLGYGFQIDTLSSLSVMFGAHDATATNGGLTLATHTSSQPVLAYESSMALTYLFAGNNGPSLSAGWRSEYWFGQLDIEADPNFGELRKSRNISSPFLRFTMPLR